MLSWESPRNTNLKLNLSNISCSQTLYAIWYNLLFLVHFSLPGIGIVPYCLLLWWKQKVLSATLVFPYFSVDIPSWLYFFFKHKATDFFFLTLFCRILIYQNNACQYALEFIVLLSSSFSAERCSTRFISYYKVY